MKVIDITQRTPEWHAWRRQGVSASEAAVMLGISPHKTPWRLWAEKTGRLEPEDLAGNPNVRRGIEFEDTARQAVERYKEECGVLLLPVCAEHDGMPWLRASLDGINDKGEPVELKCPADSTFEAVKTEGKQSEAFRLYYPQVQFQMMVTGASKGFLVFYTQKDGGALITFDLELDLNLASELSTITKDFWEAVKQDKAPPMDPGRDVFVPNGEAREAWDALAETRLRLTDAIAKEEKIVKSLKAELKANGTELVGKMGDFGHAAAAGIAVTRYEQQGAVDYTQLLRDLLPDLDPAVLASYRKAGSSRVKVTKKDTVALEQAAASAANETPVELPAFGIDKPSKGYDGEAKFAW